MRWGKPTRRDVTRLEALFDYAHRQDPDTIRSAGQTTVDQLMAVIRRDLVRENPWIVGIIVVALVAVMGFSLWVCYGAYVAGGDIPELFVATLTTPPGAFAGIFAARE